MFVARRAVRRLPSPLNTKFYTTSTKGANDAKTDSQKFISVLFYGSAIAVGYYGKEWYNKRTVSKISESGGHASANHDVPVLNISTGFPIQLSPPSDDEITRILNQESYSYKVNGIAGVQEYHGAQVQAGSPCEDRILHGKFTPPAPHSGDWMTWGIFDGHAGWEVAEILTKNLLPYIYHELGNTSFPPMQHVLETAFLALDKDIINPGPQVLNSPLPFPTAAALLVPALSGSCALLSLFDPSSQTLHTACTGDSRAVLGIQTPSGWETHVLTADQTAANASEIARLEREHPNETDMIAGNRLHGIMVMRAFGDAGWKWAAGVQEEVAKKFNGRAAKTLASPPYLTAEPVVTSTVLEPGTKKVLIMASDGLWDTMSSEQAVALVGRWLAWKAEGSPRDEAGQDAGEEEFGRFDMEKFQDSMWEFTENRTALRDGNAAVHLIRNALGGRCVDMLRGSLVYKAPLARNVRDDITVQVIFFD